MTRPQLLLVAHGTRNPRGVDMIASLADAVAGRVGPTRVAFVDVLGPSPAEVLRDSSRPTVLVPAFLASGYHVHSDVPQEVAASGHTAVSVTRALGPDPILAQVLVQRLEAAGWRPGNAVVLAAAGSSDPRALRDVRSAARMLSSLVRTTVRIAYVATGSPRVPEVVETLRAQGARRVFIASYLLWRLVWIHPFMGGNGRIARALSYLAICVGYNDWLPGTQPIPALINQHRNEYIACLEHADDAWKAEILNLDRVESFLSYMLVLQLTSDDS